VNAPTDTCVINNFFRGFGHKFIYDYKTVQTFMLAAGFVNIVRRNVGESDDVHLRGIESHGLIIGEEFNRLETLVAEATRPAWLRRTRKTGDTICSSIPHCAGFHSA